MIIEVKPQQKKRSHGQPEAKIQAECFKCAWNEFPETRKLLFHCPNEGVDDNSIRGAQRKALGLIAGVSDLILLLPRGKYHGLCIEMKTADGRQSPYQIEWQSIVEGVGYRYIICRSLEQFRSELKEYLELK